MENSNQPIHPASVLGNDGNVITVNGLTKREYFAGLAMQGLLANSTVNISAEISWQRAKNFAIDSVKLADELLKQLETT